MRDALRAGAERVIVGTAAFRDVDFLDDDRRAPSAPRVVVSVDVRGGHDLDRGLDRRRRELPAGGRDPPPAATAASRSFVYTDVDRDGTLEGPDLDDVRAVAEAVRGRFLYSGGIGSLERPARAARGCARSTSPA